jgi:hypothetical protein
MNFEVYCDEAFPDLFMSRKPKARHLMIGSLWLPDTLRDELKTKIKHLRAAHDAWGEIKWSKVSPSKLGFFLDLIDLFFAHGDNLRFRCIMVEREHVDFGRHHGDQELGFYKFYYQVLHQWIQDFNEYRVFCDLKSNRDPERFQTLRRVLSNANLLANVHCVQALPSREVVLIQFCDLLLGAVSARVNDTLRAGSAKERLVLEIEERLGKVLAPTYRDAKKINIFKINLRGGW